MTVVVTEDAFDDIRRNARWWALHRSAEQAARWYDDIRTAIAALDDRPGRWPLASENRKFPYEIREYHFGLGSRSTHRVIFTIQEERVIVIAVRHAAQDELNPDDIAPLP